MPIQLLEEALSAVDEGVAETVCMGSRIPRGTVKRLLTHSCEGVSTGAAIGLWLAEPQGAVPEDLEAKWTEAILKATAGDDNAYWLGEILAQNPPLAREWLSRRAADEGIRYRFYLPDAYEKAVGALNPQDRQELFRELGTDFGTHWRSRQAADRSDAS